MDMNHLKSLGVEERVPEWRRILAKFNDRWGRA